MTAVAPTAAARALFYALSILALLDAVTTGAALTLAGGYEMEANPIARAAFERWGLVGPLTARVVIGVLAAWIGTRIVVSGYAGRRLPDGPPARLHGWLWHRGPRWYRTRARVEAALLTLVVVITAMVVGSNAVHVADLAASAGLL